MIPGHLQMSWEPGSPSGMSVHVACGPLGIMLTALPAHTVYSKLLRCLNPLKEPSHQKHSRSHWNRRRSEWALALYESFYLSYQVSALKLCVLWWCVKHSKSLGQRVIGCGSLIWLDLLIIHICMFSMLRQINLYLRNLGLYLTNYNGCLVVEKSPTWHWLLMVCQDTVSDSSELFFSYQSVSVRSVYPSKAEVLLIPPALGRKYNTFLEKKEKTKPKNVFLTLCALSNLNVCGRNVGLTTVGLWRPCIKGSWALRMESPWTQAEL